ncbi:MAG: hypothetical protein AAGF95_32175 [Chloroflexota bacterium]
MELVQPFIDVIIALFDFVVAYLIPTSAADVNLIHIGIWTPVIIGLVSSVVVMIKGFWGGASRRRA